MKIRKSIRLITHPANFYFATFGVDCFSIFMGNIASGARYCYFFGKIFYWKVETTRFENTDEGQPVLFSSFFL